MKSRRIFISIFVPLVLLLVAIAGLAHAQGLEPITSSVPQSPRSIDASTPLSTGFTYQGQLELDGEPVDDACWFALRLYDDASGGNQVGDAITTTEAITVTDGLFSLTLNAGSEFGPSAFNGNARWLDIRVKCPNDPTFVDLGRQELTAAPYALHAVNADTLDGRHVSQVARLDRYSIPGESGGTVTMTIPHYNAFQITIGEAYADPNKVAWLSAIENDAYIAWTGIDSNGTVVTGTAMLDSTDTILTLGEDITLRCPGNGELELVLTSSFEDVRAILTW